MGQCYSVHLKLRIRDTKGLKKALSDKIARGEEEHTNYNLDHYREIGVDTDTLDGQLQVVFGGWNARLKPAPDGTLESDFSCCYGWEAVMLDIFDTMAPFLKDGASLKIYPDTSFDLLVVKGGKAIQKH